MESSSLQFASYCIKCPTRMLVISYPLLPPVLMNKKAGMQEGRKIFDAISSGAIVSKFIREMEGREGRKGALRSRKKGRGMGVKLRGHSAKPDGSSYANGGGERGEREEREGRGREEMPDLSLSLLLSILSTKTTKCRRKEQKL